MYEPFLKAEAITYTYEGGAQPALDGLSLEIRRGRKVACMGPNGSGKSTFFLCCNGILKPEAGTISFNGAPIDYSRKGLLSLRSKVGLVFQDPDHQLFSASVFEDISFGPLNLGLSEEETHKRVSSVIERLGITPFAQKPVHALSGGQKKLVAIADILVMEPELIILDEPAAALDPKHTRLVQEIIDEIAAEGITVLMATHDVDYAWTWADDVLLFHEGRLLAGGAPEQVFENKKLLRAAGLEQPSILALAQSLKRKGILPEDTACPRTLGELEQQLTNPTQPSNPT